MEQHSRHPPGRRRGIAARAPVERALHAEAPERCKFRRKEAATATPSRCTRSPTKKWSGTSFSHMPLRVSALRSLGAYMNVFSIESFMDDIAAAAHVDPVEFRLRHLDDPRAREVVTLAAQRFGWGKRSIAPNHGVGFAFARYKNLASYCAVACEIAVEPDTGDIRLLHATAAIDSGEIVNPDGIRNQTEGGILQSMSWTLFEAVQFNQTRVTTADWATYPILRFAHVPDSIQVHVIPRTGTALPRRRRGSSRTSGGCVEQCGGQCHRNANS